jgi:hypothetical protein
MPAGERVFSSYIQPPVEWVLWLIPGDKAGGVGFITHVLLCKSRTRAELYFMTWGGKLYSFMLLSTV